MLNDRVLTQNAELLTLQTEVQWLYENNCSLSKQYQPLTCTAITSPYLNAPSPPLNTQLPPAIVPSPAPLPAPLAISLPAPSPTFSNPLLLPTTTGPTSEPLSPQMEFTALTSSSDWAPQSSSETSGPPATEAQPLWYIGVGIGGAALLVALLVIVLVVRRMRKRSAEEDEPEPDPVIPAAGNTRKEQNYVEMRPYLEQVQQSIQVNLI